MKFKFKRIISLIMAIATVFTLAGSSVYAADSGGHASVGGSTVPGHYSQASSSQIGAGVTATDTASGLKLSVIRTDYSADTKADDVSAYESGILYGHTVLSGPASYSSDASEFLGTMPIYFRNQNLSEKSISTEAYVADDGNLYMFDISNYIVSSSSAGIDSELTEAYNKIYNTFSNLNFNPGAALRDNQLTDGILYSGNVEDMSDEQLESNKNTYRALAYMVIKAYSGVNNDTYKALEQMYETGNSVYGNYEYIFLVEPLAALNNTGGMGRFYMAPNQLGQYYLKSAGYDITNMVYSGSGKKVSGTVIQTISKWTSENRSTPKTGFGFVYSWVFGYNSDSDTVLKRMWYSGFKDARQHKATKSDGMFGWGTLRPLDYIAPTNETKATVNVTVSHIDIADGTVSGYTQSTNEATTSMLKDISFEKYSSRSLNSIDELVNEYNGVLKSAGIDGNDSEALARALMMYSSLGSNVPITFLDEAYESVMGLSAVENGLSKASLVKERDGTVMYEAEDGTRYITAGDMFEEFDKSLFNNDNDRALVGWGVSVTEYNDTITIKQADALIALKAAQLLNEKIKAITDSELKKYDDGKVGFGFGTGASRYINIMDTDISELYYECMIEARNEIVNALDGNSLSINSLYGGNDELYRAAVDKYGEANIVNELLNNFKVTTVNEALQKNFNRENNFGKLMGAGMYLLFMYNAGLDTETIMNQMTGIGLSAILGDTGVYNIRESEFSQDSDLVLKNGTSSSHVVVVDDDAASVNVAWTYYNEDTDSIELIPNLGVWEDTAKIGIRYTDEDTILKFTAPDEILVKNDDGSLSKYFVNYAVVNDNKTDLDKFMSNLSTEYVDNNYKLKESSNANDNNIVPVIEVPDGFDYENDYIMSVGTDGNLNAGDAITIVLLFEKAADIKVVEVYENGGDKDDTHTDILKNNEVPEDIVIDDKDGYKMTEWFVTHDDTYDVDELTPWEDIDGKYEVDTEGTDPVELPKEDFEDEDTTIFVHYETANKLVEVYEDADGNVINVEVDEEFTLPHVVANKDKFEVVEWALVDSDIESVNSWADIESHRSEYLNSGDGEAYVPKADSADSDVITLAIRYRTDEKTLKVVKVYEKNESKLYGNDIVVQTGDAITPVDITDSITKGLETYELEKWFITKENTSSVNTSTTWNDIEGTFTPVDEGDTSGTITPESGTVFIKYVVYTVNAIKVLEDANGNYVKTEVDRDLTLHYNISSNMENGELQEWSMLGGYLDVYNLRNSDWTAVRNASSGYSVIQSGADSRDITEADYGGYVGAVTIIVRYREVSPNTPINVDVTGQLELKQNEVTKKYNLTDYNNSPLTSTGLFNGSFTQGAGVHKDSKTVSGTSYCSFSINSRTGRITATGCYSGCTSWSDYYNTSCPGHYWENTYWRYCNYTGSWVDTAVRAVISATVNDNKIIGNRSSLAPLLRDNEKSISNWNTASAADKKMTPDADFIIHRGYDVVTLASWANTSQAINDLAILGYGSGVTPIGARSAQSYTRNSSIKLALSGTDLSVAKQCKLNKFDGTTTYAEHRASIMANSITYRGSTAVQKYSDVTGSGTNIPSVSNSNIKINGITFKSSNITAKSGSNGNVSYYPYVKMVYDTVTGSTGIPVYVLAENKSTIALNASMLFGWNTNNGESLILDSNQLSTHQKAVSAYGKDKVIPGGAVLNISSNNSNNPTLGMVSWSAYISDDVYNNVRGMDSSLNGKTLTNAVSEHDNAWSQLKSTAENNVKIQMYASTNDSSSIKYDNSSFKEVYANATFNGTRLSNDTKYWLVPASVRNESNESGIDFKNEKEVKTYYRVRTEKTTGALVVEKGTSGSSWSTITTANAGNWNSVLRNSEVAEIDKYTSLVSNMISAMEQRKGDAGWYTELWDGFCVVKIESTVEIALTRPYVRSHIIDVKLTPELESKSDMFNKYISMCYRITAKNNSVYTTYKGSKLTLKNPEILGGSNTLFIPNVTVSDLD